ncbi:MAG: polysaccharide pyruvyl transferase family protein [Thermoguttaceae bacterium]
MLQTLGPSMNHVRGRNIGNGYISYAILKILFGGPVKVAHLPNAWEDPLPQSLADRINQTCSHFIFIMQDFIRDDFQALPFERINQFLEKIRIPVVPISLGANCFNGYDGTLVSRLSKEQKRFLSLISEKSAMIGVRGKYSAEVLGQLGSKNVQITGCPSFFESGETRTIVKRPWNPDGALTTGSFFNARLPGSVHMLQDEMYFIDVLFLLGAENRLDPNTEARPFNEFDIQSSLHLHLKARQGLLQFFLNFGQWEQFYKDQKWCLTIGTRLHSAIFSYNRGVPAIVTNGDARCRETCEHLGIPHRPDLGPNSNIAEEYEKLDLSSMNQKYSYLHANFIEYLKVHGLHQACVGNKVEYFQFPLVEKPAAPQVLEALHGGFTKLAIFCDDKIQQCREIDEVRQKAEDARKRLQIAEDRLQIAEDALIWLQITDGRLQIAEGHVRELERFRASKAGRIAARLQILKHYFLKALHSGASRLRKFRSFREEKKDAA